jgi:hypothetical protein
MSGWSRYDALAGRVDTAPLTVAAGSLAAIGQRLGALIAYPFEQISCANGADYQDLYPRSLLGRRALFGARLSQSRFGT